MENKNYDLQCEIVRDLLPTYAEGLASEVTERAVKQHLGSCEECTKIWTDMQSELTLDKPPKKDKINVKIMKKLKTKTARAVLITVGFVGLLVGAFLYASLWGVGVKMEDVKLIYTVSDSAEEGGAKEYLVDIRLKGKGALELAFVDDNLDEDHKSMMFEYELRRVLPNARYDKILYPKDKDEHDNVKRFTLGFTFDDKNFDPDDSIKLNCSDGTYTITVEDIIANAEKSN